MARLDSRSAYPEDMEKYLEYYGWHFSKKMCQWAVSRMYKTENGKRQYITPYTKEELDTFLEKQKIELQHNEGYDYVYVANMAKADFLGSSIPDETHLAKFIKDYVEDPDAYEGMPFTRFVADTVGAGIPIIWSDML